MSDQVLIVALCLAVLAQVVKAEAESHTADLDGVDVHYLIRPPADGSDSPRTLVFVHGWSCDHTVWRDQMSAFAKHRLIAVDLPGHGLSDKPERDYTMDYFADALAAVLDDAKIERAVLVGHSAGTPVIRQFWRRHAKRTEALVVVDGFLKAFLTPEQVEAMKGQLSGPSGNAKVRQMFLGMAPRSMNDEERETYLAMVLSTPEHVRISSYVAAADPEIWTPDPIEVPTLAIMTDAPYWNEAYVASVRELVPDLEYHVIPDVSHFVMIDAPQRFNELVEEFLE